MIVNYRDGPFVTILMPAYNSEKFIDSAIKSILGQSYKNFEFLIILDPSTDDTEKIIEMANDPRIKLIKNKERIGLIKSLNLGIELSEGNYIARMDSDDISDPDRISQQVQFLEKNEMIDICGTSYTNKPLGQMSILFSELLSRFFSSPNMIQSALFFRSPIGHPTVMVRTSVLKKNFYSAEYRTCEDYELWVRLSDNHKFSILTKTLLFYRVHDQAISIEYREKQNQCSDKIRMAQMQQLGVTFTPEQTKFHLEIFCGMGSIRFIQVFYLFEWVNKLVLANHASQRYPEFEFGFCLYSRFFRIIYNKIHGLM